MAVTTEATLQAAVEAGRSASGVSMTVGVGNRSAGNTGISHWIDNGGAAPTTWAACDNTTTGGIDVLPVNGGGTGLRLVESAFGSGYYTGQGVMPDACHEIIDRLGAVGGLSGSSTSKQSFSMGDLTSARGINSDGSNLAFGVEWATSSGGTSVTMTWDVTYWDDSTGTFSTIHPSGGTTHLWQWIRVTGGKYPKALTAVQLGATTGSSNLFSVVACRLVGIVKPRVTRNGSRSDLLQLGLGPVSSTACLQLLSRSIYFGTGIGGRILVAKG